MDELQLSDDRPLLTVRDVEKWREEKATLEKQIEGLQAHLSEVDRKLAAASLFLPPDSPKTIPLAPMADGVILTLPDVIIQILQQSDKPLTKREIRQRVDMIVLWREKLEANSNYYYTVISRLVRRSRILKEGKSYRVAYRVASEHQDARSNEHHHDLAS